MTHPHSTFITIGWHHATKHHKMSNNILNILRIFAISICTCYIELKIMNKEKMFREKSHSAQGAGDHDPDPHTLSPV